MTRRKESWTCLSCDNDFDVEIMCSDEPQAPDMMTFPSGAWVGCIKDEEGSVSMLAVCSEECASKIFVPGHVICEEHGRMPWNGEICCDRCERVFTTHDERLPTAAPDVCPCGAVLSPSEARRRGVDFSGRTVCSVCFAGKSAPSTTRGTA